MTGRLAVVGLGPGAAVARHAEAAAALARRPTGRLRPVSGRACPRAPGSRRHASDNREELDRARHALALAAAGRRVAVVSGGDAGVFGMASAVFEAMEAGAPALARARGSRWFRASPPCMAVAARVGAPLGARFLRAVAVGQSQALAAD